MADHKAKQLSKKKMDDDGDQEVEEAGLLLFSVLYCEGFFSPSRSFKSLLSLQARRNRLNSFRRKALLSYRASPFIQVYNSGQDDAMITLTGFDYQSFHRLLQPFSVMFEQYTPFTSSGFLRKITPKSGGRPRKIDAKGCLALYLTWTRTRGSTRMLQLVFVSTKSKVGVYIRFAKRLVCKALHNHRDARIVFPNEVEAVEFCGRINEKYPVLDNVYGAMAGIKICVEASGIPQDQRRFYNG